MLGARARAAEYNAAKAASARQQASQEADGLKIPKPPPTPLSAFARNASASRNKGIKTFKPLVLTEEEGSSSSVEQENEQENEQPKSPSSETAEPPRSASLPPPQTATNVQPEITRTVKTPHRFHEGPYIPFAPRAMLAEDYFYSQHSHMHHLQQYMHYQPNYPTISAPPQVLSAPHIGWFSSPEQYDNSYSYPDPGLPPTTPVPEERPQLERKCESAESAAPDTELDKTQSSQTSPSITKQTVALGGPTNYIFGPDDLEPAKCEVKQQAREQAYKAHVEATERSKFEESIKNTRSAEPSRKSIAEEDLLHLFKRTPTISSQDKALSGAPDLLAGRKLSELLEAHTRGHSSYRPATVRKSSTPLVPNEADWPYLGQDSAYYSSNESHSAETKSIPGVRTDDAGERLKHMLLESLKLKAEADAAAAVIRPPPGLPRPKPQKPRLLDSRAEQITNLKFPLVDLDSEEWLDIRPLTEQKRNQMRRIYETVKTCSISDKYKDTWEDRGALPRPEFQEHLDESKQEFLRRRKQIDDLADEMQRKWEYGDSFRSATMETKEAKQQAGIVKAVGGIMSALNMQLEDKDGCHYRGTRPYCTAPDYAIRRNTGLDKQEKSSSLFEPDEGPGRVVPMRLARDPRFRPQLGEAIKLDETRVPRMFVKRRA